jgi:hypothetical protein
MEHPTCFICENWAKYMVFMTWHVSEDELYCIDLYSCEDHKQDAEKFSSDNGKEFVGVTHDL